MPTSGSTVWVFQGGQWVQGTVGTAAGTSGFWVTLGNGQQVSVSTGGQGTTWSPTNPSAPSGTTPTAPTGPTSGSPTPTSSGGSGFTPTSYTPPGTPGGATSYPTAPTTNPTWNGSTQVWFNGVYGQISGPPGNQTFFPAARGARTAHTPPGK